jgi:hypothetical protein
MVVVATKILCFVVGTPDELAGQVQKELDILNELDTIIMEKLDTRERWASCTCTVPSPNFSEILNKILREGISVSIQFID